MDGRFPQTYNQPSPYYPPEKPGIRLSFVLGLIFVLVIAGVASLFLFFPSGGSEQGSLPETDTGSKSLVVGCLENWVCTDWGDCVGGTETRVCQDTNNCGTVNSKPLIERSCTANNEETPSSPKENKVTVFSCNDWNCFIGASEICELSNFTTPPTTTDLFGILVTTTTYYEITEKDASTCTLKLRTEEQHVNYSDEFIQFQLDSGATIEEIDETLQIGNQAADLLEGREGTCKFDASDLTSLLTRWSQGSFSGGASCSVDGGGNTECTYTGDFEVAKECEGEYFVAPEV